SYELLDLTRSWTSKVLSGRKPGEDQATPPPFEEKNYELNQLSLVQIVILLQFTVSIALTIFAVVGTAINQPVGLMLLLALLQFLITVPGFAFYFTKKPAHFFAYLVLQAITGGSEVIWFIYSVISNTYTVITVLVLLLLICVQTAALLSATVLRHVNINLNDELPAKLKRRSRRRRRRSKDSRTSTESRKHSSGDHFVSQETLEGQKASKGEEGSSPPSPHRRRTSKDLEQGPDESTRPMKPGVLERRSRIREESVRHFNEGRERIRELAQQLRLKERLGRTHSDPSLNAKKDEEESKEGAKKSFSTESSTQNKTSQATAWSAASLSGQQPSRQELSSAARKAQEPPRDAASGSVRSALSRTLSTPRRTSSTPRGTPTSQKKDVHPHDLRQPRLNKSKTTNSYVKFVQVFRSVVYQSTSLMETLSLIK
ncbi:hypothetical protein GCK32_003884, partial [Trichostrongylus colubriformis]